MKIAKIKKQPQKEIANSVETYSFKSMIKILISLLVIFGIFYFITILLIDNRKLEDVGSSPAVIDSSKITLSQLLNRKEDEYYVIDSWLGRLGDLDPTPDTAINLWLWSKS